MFKQFYFVPIVLLGISSIKLEKIGFVLKISRIIILLGISS